MKNDRIMNIGIPLPFDVLLIIQDILNKEMENRIKKFMSLGNYSLKLESRLKVTSLVFKRILGKYYQSVSIYDPWDLDFCCSVLHFYRFNFSSLDYKDIVGNRLAQLIIERNIQPYSTFRV